MRRIFHENGLTLVLFAMFLFSIVGQTLTGEAAYNDERRDHNQPPVNLTTYLTTGHFVEAVFENWESEFLQMGLYVLLTSWLFQKGSAESKPFGDDDASDADPRESRNQRDAPWPVHAGGVSLRLYEHSLSAVLLALFAICVVVHAAGGVRAYNEEQLQHGGEVITTLGYLATSQFWFESFQNWQSEFLSIVALVLLSIFLRERGSPESKPVAAPHSQTGD